MSKDEFLWWRWLLSLPGSSSVWGNYCSSGNAEPIKGGSDLQTKEDRDSWSNNPVPFFLRSFPAGVFPGRAPGDFVVWFKVELPLCLTVWKRKRGKKACSKLYEWVFSHFAIDYFLHFLYTLGRAISLKTIIRPIVKSHLLQFSPVFFMLLSSKA